MSKEYLPYFNELDDKYKEYYMEWSKEVLIDHLIANIKNGEVLLERIEKAKEYIIQERDGDYLLADYDRELHTKDLYIFPHLLRILNGEE